MPFLQHCSWAMRALIKSSHAPEAAVPAHGEHQKQQLPRSGKKLQHPSPTQESELQNPKNIGHPCSRMVAVGAPGVHILPGGPSQTWGSLPAPPRSNPASHCIFPTLQPQNPPRTMLWPLMGHTKMMQPMPRSSSFPHVFIYSLPCILCLQIFSCRRDSQGRLLQPLLVSVSHWIVCLNHSSKLWGFLCLHKGTLHKHGRGEGVKMHPQEWIWVLSVAWIDFHHLRATVFHQHSNPRLLHHYAQYSSQDLLCFTTSLWEFYGKTEQIFILMGETFKYWSLAHPRCMTNLQSLQSQFLLLFLTLIHSDQFIYEIHSQFRLTTIPIFTKTRGLKDYNNLLFHSLQFSQNMSFEQCNYRSFAWTNCYF